ncbi:3-oxo-5-alpha-steroid 4-dehydrogenase 1 isoform X2 [Rhineura floridana]|uniref:3-oxo-5-alpha-steroid 4-dehydrogenase 1 isoform X2 n=1 Tax=Rhineura floridana TaxID=261503 RepID=UPI002AC86AB2|nr:3-oxo-5-alpha-steroid 4-dehydrogenase 1 isoform X2 [Rhineura floridana]
MEEAAALSRSVCSGGFWRRISGPEEKRVMELMSYGLMGSMAAAVVLAKYIQLPYGRYTSLSFGRPVPAKLAWAVQEAPAFLVPLILVLCSDGARLSFWPNRTLLALFFIHYTYRSFIFPFLIRGGKPTPAFTFLLAFIFCLYNGYLQGRSLSNYAEYSSDWLTVLRFILGFTGWLSGLLIHVHSDNILRNLRKPGETGYKIPRGGMFEYVSGANFFGEILEWCGFAVACCTLESTAFATSTFLILGRRAYSHHHTSPAPARPHLTQKTT